MSTTLTNGLKLPDKGSVDWYADMQNNYTILDGAVGTVAEHTTQIAGKAPAVHTHTKSDITDFPAYGNTAGTICEGNDSRLSDARTPVAHTHTKADVTDLLNSNFIPSANNSYDLGSSSYQWNNLYAKRVNTQSINGINPGALSLPSSDSADYIDLSSNLNANAEYQYTAPYDGWLCLYILVNEFYQENAVGLYRSDTSANSHQWAKSVTAAINLYKQNKYQGSVMLPVESGKKYICYLSLNANTTIHNKYLFFYKNKGNV